MNDKEVTLQSEVALTSDITIPKLSAVPPIDEIQPVDYFEKIQILREAMDNVLKVASRPVEIEVGKVYAIRSSIPLDLPLAEAVVNEFRSATGATAIIFDNTIINVEELVMDELKAGIIAHLKQQLPYFTNDVNGLVTIETVIDVIEGRQGVTFKKVE